MPAAINANTSRSTQTNIEKPIKIKPKTKSPFAIDFPALFAIGDEKKKLNIITIAPF